MGNNPTVNQVNDQVQDLDRKVKGLGYHVDELKRQARGITPANRKASQAELAHKRLARDVEKLSKRIDAIDSNGSAVQANAFQQEIARLNGRTDSLWGDLNTQLQELSDRIDHVGTRTAEAHDEIVEIRKAPMLDIDPEKTKLDLSSKVDRQTPWGRAIFVGFIVAGFSALVLLTQADSWSDQRALGFSVVLGLAVMCFFASFETFNVDINGGLIWGRREKKEITKQLPAVVEDDSNSDEKSKMSQEVTA